MLVELPGLWIALLNIAVIPLAHFGVSWLFTRLPQGWFRPAAFPFREGLWERGGKFYEGLFGVRRWKGLLPDAAPWFKGFPKKNLRNRDPGYLRAFRAETCRGEAAHYAQIPALLVTLGWNPWPVAACVMIAYAFLSNLPCIIIQRHTRARIGHLLAQLERKQQHSAAP